MYARRLHPRHRCGTRSQSSGAAPHLGLRPGLPLAHGRAQRWSLSHMGLFVRLTWTMTAGMMRLCPRSLGLVGIWVRATHVMALTQYDTVRPPTGAKYPPTPTSCYATDERDHSTRGSLPLGLTPPFQPPACPRRGTPRHPATHTSRRRLDLITWTTVTT